MSGSVPGYPTPALDPDDIRADPDQDNPNELVLEPEEVEATLPPVPAAHPGPDEGEPED